MGYGTARDLRQYLDQDSLLEWHLKGNVYPPLPVSLVPACKRAIELANEGEWFTFLPLVGIQHRQYGNSVPVEVLITDLHLEAFLGEPEEDDEDLEEEE
ncbi:MAG: hypothetical protein V3S55_06620 [Nitrospiraceae bacterium]